jgi:hypothetical protein
MSDSYTLTVDGAEYELTEAFRAYVQETAENSFEGNEYVSTWWKQSDGDPILVIETAGKKMPYRYIDELDPNEMPDGEEEEVDERLHFMQEPEQKENIGQVEREDDETTIPEKPQEMPEDDVLVAPVPNVEPYDKWAVGKAVTPMQGIYERNLQAMVDADGDIEAHSEEKQSSLDVSTGSWEWLVQRFDCEQVGSVDYTEQSDEAQRKPEGWFDSPDEDDTVSEGSVGNRWNL